MNQVYSYKKKVEKLRLCQLTRNALWSHFSVTSKQNHRSASQPFLLTAKISAFLFIRCSLPWSEKWSPYSRKLNSEGRQYANRCEKIATFRRCNYIMRIVTSPVFAMYSVLHYKPTLNDRYPLRKKARSKNSLVFSVCFIRTAL